MRNYIIKPGVRGVFSMDAELNDFDVIDPIASHIDWVYTIPEDGEVQLKNGAKKQVKKGDVVVVFYASPYTKNQFVVVDSEEWRENIKLEDEYKEAQKQSDNESQCCDCVDCCCEKSC